MIVNKYQGNGGGGGGSYVLPPATANRLGGIKVGSGLTITNDGTLSTEEATVIDLAVLSAMTSADRIAIWDEVYAKVYGGKSVFMKGLVYGEADRTAILPVVSFRPETSAATHEGGNIFFGAKGDTDNIYFHINFGSDGSINPTDGMVKTFIAGKASAETLGLVKVGSGLTIDASGVLSATGGGSGEQNYVIVDALSAITNPVEGMMAYVPSYVKETNTYTKIYISDFEHFTENTDGRPENFLARIHWGDWVEADGSESLLASQVYQSGNNFFWDWNNDNKYYTRDLERDGNYYKIEYRCYPGEAGDGSDAYFEFRAIDQTPWGDYAFEIYQYVSTAATSYDVIEPAKTYTYNGEDWVRASDFVYDWKLIEPATSADTAELISDIRKNVENGIYPSIFYHNKMLRYEDDNMNAVSFYVAGPGNSYCRINLSALYFNEDSFDERGVYEEEGELVDVSIYAYNWLEADYSTGHLSGDYSCVSYGSESIWKVWFKRGNGDDMIITPLKWRNHYTTEVDGEQKTVWVFSADIPFETANGIEVWNGVWSVLQDDWYSDNAHTLSWTKVSGPLVDSNYPIYTPSE